MKDLIKYGDTKIDLVAEHFCQYVILQNKKSKQTFQVQFGDIIEFKHSHPLLINQQYFIVLSNGVFHQSKMCYIAPYNKEDEDIDYSLLHCIDFEERKIVKIDNKECLKKDKIVSEIKQMTLNNTAIV